MMNKRCAFTLIEIPIAVMLTGLLMNALLMIAGPGSDDE